MTVAEGADILMDDPANSLRARGLGYRPLYDSVGRRRGRGAWERLTPIPGALSLISYRFWGGCVAVIAAVMAGREVRA
jgi:hypothetical protein